MDNYLKTKKVKIKALNDTALLLRALSAAGQADIMDAIGAGEDNFRVALITCSHCVLDWADESIESIAANISYEAVIEIADAAAILTGVEYDPKDSKSDRDAA